MDVETPSGTRQMWFAGEHREVVDGERLVYTEFMADEHGNTWLLRTWACPLIIR